MRILCVGDFHGEFPVKLRRLARDVDLVVSTGDFFPWKLREVFLDMGHEGYELFLACMDEEELGEIVMSEIEEGDRDVIARLDKLGRKVFTTIGNYDHSGINDQYEAEFLSPRDDPAGPDEDSYESRVDMLAPILSKYSNIERIDYLKKEFGGINFIGGFGHSSPGQVKSKAYREHRKILDGLFGSAKGGPNIFVCHNMPFDCELDVVNGEDALEEARGEHYGSKLVRRVIDRWQPVLAIGGHFHENQGKCKIGKTVVLNPGAAMNGEAAVVEVDGTRGKIKNIKFVK